MLGINHMKLRKENKWLWVKKTGTKKLLLVEGNMSPKTCGFSRVGGLFLIDKHQKTAMNFAKHSTLRSLRLRPAERSQRGSEGAD